MYVLPHSTEYSGRRCTEYPGFQISTSVRNIRRPRLHSHTPGLVILVTRRLARTTIFFCDVTPTESRDHPAVICTSDPPLVSALLHTWDTVRYLRPPAAFSHEFFLDCARLFGQRAGMARHHKRQLAVLSTPKLPSGCFVSVRCRASAVCSTAGLVGRLGVSSLLASFVLLTLFPPDRTNTV